jgi:hypothetical protein
LGHTTVVPGGTTTVVCEGGGGLLLLKLRQPPSNSGSSRDNSRMARILTGKTNGHPVRHASPSCKAAGLVPGQSADLCHCEFTPPGGDDRARAGAKRSDVGDRVFNRKSVFRLGLSRVFARASVSGLTGH